MMLLHLALVMAFRARSGSSTTLAFDRPPPVIAPARPRVEMLLSQRASRRATALRVCRREVPRAVRAPNAPRPGRARCTAMRVGVAKRFFSNISD
jgi:hypothetical protein